MESRTKKFHFQEIDWIIYFPRHGNKGKYRDYKVLLRNRKKEAAHPTKMTLGEVLDKPEIEQGYPHTVGYYKVSSGRGVTFKPQYLELRRIHVIEDLWFFLNAVDI